MEYPCCGPMPGRRQHNQIKRTAVHPMGCLHPHVPTATLMAYIVACPDPALLEALCAFAHHLQALPSTCGLTVQATVRALGRNPGVTTLLSDGLAKRTWGRYGLSPRNGSHRPVAADTALVTSDHTKGR